MTRGVVIHAALGFPGTVITELSGTEPWQPRILPSAAGAARVALVQSRASLLAGDDVTLSVVVGEGAALELVELAATLAHHARGGQAAVVGIEVEVGMCGSLVWLGEPLIVAAGACARRTLSLDLARAARALLGERVVLGRAREQSGALVARTRITCDGAPVLDETLDTRDLEVLTSAVVAGDARMVAGLSLAGARDLDAPVGAMQAEGPATLWRSVGEARAGGGWPDALAARWQELAMTAPSDPFRRRQRNSRMHLEASKATR